MEALLVMMFASLRSLIELSYVRGIDHQIPNIPSVIAGGVVKTQHGSVIAILHQYAYTGQGKTIHSSGQLEWYKNDVNDKSIKVAGGL